MEKPYQVPIQYLKGIGPKRAELFNKLGVYSVEDLLYYFPRRYQDRTKFSPIAGLRPGEIYTIKAEVMARGQRRAFRGRGLNITEAAVADDTGKISCVWFNQPYLKNYFEVGTKVILYGKVDLYGKRLQMSSPDFEILKDEDGSFGAGGFFPVYSLPDGLTQRFFRNILKYALEHYLPRLDDFLPYDIRSRNNLHNLAKSLLEIHFPQDLNSRQEALRRLSFEEFFLFQMPLVLRKRKQKELKGIAHKIDGPLLPDFFSCLPFKFTSAQANVMEEIKSDMASTEVMQRLLQGDVGSGKTVVASTACVIAIDGGYQAAFMVPTEILAKQHYEKIKSWTVGRGPLDAGGENQKEKIKIGLLTSSLSKIEKEKIYADIKAGRINLIIGTHALLEEGVKFKNLGLVVIDEQHKFGVGQRALLPAKGPNPDVLIMTATPIPRTLAITLYGDLDISVINEMPPGRLPVQTLHFDKREKKKAYALVKKELEQANQAY
ncbi:MAG: ATP-dependent DNA helicase RecG, partial [Candidatus Omnitrophota bacterium]|nr:ATP-dependent DNA helicase RecG [Candidatus Omnitrophota bacterium]